MPKYTVVSVQNTVYLDKGGKAVNGYIVTASLPDYNEELQVKVPNIEPATVKAELDKLTANRDALAKLG